MKDAKIIAIVGMPGSGKSTCVNFFKKNGFNEIYFGGIVVDTVRERDLVVNEVNERLVREELREIEGMAVMAKRSLPKITALIENNQNVIIDDMYSFDEYKLLHDKYDDRLFVVAVVTPREIRHNRLAIRPNRPLTSTEAHSRDISQIENLDIGGSIAIADYYLPNNASLEELANKLDMLLEKLDI